MKYFKITLSNLGGEFNIGSIKAKESIEELNMFYEAMKDSDISYDEPLSNNTIISDFNNIAHLIGPKFNESLNIKISNYNDLNLQYPIDSNEFSFESLNHEIKNNNNTHYLAPTLTEYIVDISLEVDKKYLAENDLLLGGFFLDRNLQYNVRLELDDSQTFSTNNLFIGLSDISSMLSYEPIVTSVYYFTEDIKEKIIKNYFEDIGVEKFIGDSFDLNFHMVFSYIRDMTNANHKKEYMDLINKCKLEVFSIDTSGKVDSRYVVIRDKNDIELYRHDGGMAYITEQHELDRIRENILNKNS